jgi:hypothetical protein
MYEKLKILQLFCLEREPIQPLTHFPLAWRYFSYDFLGGNRITLKAFFFQDAQKIKYKYKNTYYLAK